MPEARVAVVSLRHLSHDLSHESSYPRRGYKHAASTFTDVFVRLDIGPAAMRHKLGHRDCPVKPVTATDNPRATKGSNFLAHLPGRQGAQEQQTLSTKGNHR